MKIKLEFELTPQEFRESLGMPDVAGIQTKAIEMMKSRMTKDLKGVDMPGIVEGWLSQGLSTSRQMQQLFTSLVSGQSEEPASKPRKSSTKSGGSK